ncbi:MAG: 4-hydroxythreonine-4-phosphate dehydrogenase PdxA [Dehalococcoidia bacterium]|nr:4-hydroxythreonine-4-phosphate dehydrogenase PdxA [Dehalococcoidia bacterium]
MTAPRLALTMGDPSGIGPEVLARALANDAIREQTIPAVIGNRRVLQAAIERYAPGLRVESVDAVPSANSADVVPVLDLDGYEDTEFPVGELSVDSARAAHAWIERAARLCLDGSVEAMVTAPINKEAFRLAGITDTGHQEILQRLSGSSYVATMLVSGELRCMHLSTHKPLAEACAFVTRANVLRAIELTHDHFIRWGFERPRIAVAALNPHASDNGLIGRDELDEITPAIEDAIAKGIQATGPHPADSVFNQAIDGRYDVVVVMYHDQGHIAIKVHGFETRASP